MQNSLALLQDETNDFISRCTLLEDFKNKFETIISSELISAFNSKSIGIIIIYKNITINNVSRNNLKLTYFTFFPLISLFFLGENIRSINVRNLCILKIIVIFKISSSFSPIS